MKTNSQQKSLSLHACGSVLTSVLIFTACNGGGGSASPTQAVSVPYTASPQALSSAWANDGGDKVAQEETRGTSLGQNNSVWNNSKINLFGAKNEVLGFNVVLEAANGPINSVKVTFNELDGPNGAKITSQPATGDGVYDYTNRDIELFYIKYLKIQGLSKVGYEEYDERHIPHGLQRPWTGAGAATGTWTDRPNHDKSYPDIAVPMDVVNTFNIAQGQSQSVWGDIYIPSTATPGTYEGSVQVYEGSHLSYTLPVELTVHNFALPDVPSSKTMLDVGYADIAQRYIGNASPSSASDLAKVRTIRDRHFQMAHRHKISLIDNNSGTDGSDQPAAEWIPRLDGSLFTAANGYRGPGTGTGNNVFSVGTYGSWTYENGAANVMQTHANNWATWFATNSPNTDYFLYLIDESSNYTQIQTWATTLSTDSGSGRNLASMATMPLPTAITNTPGLEVVASTMDVGDTTTWNNAQASSAATGHHFYMYNGKRPASGSFMTDDDGVALREVPWGQYKKGVERWFYWESTYYNDYQSGRGQNNVLNSAQTFGAAPTTDSVVGQTSGLYSNGDGVMFYPGTDTLYPSSSYGLDGPMASVRMKEWRRGIQDVDYITLANQISPTRTAAIVNGMAKSVLWENGVADQSDPTWVKCDIGWSINPDDWEAARLALANIIEGK